MKKSYWQIPQVCYNTEAVWTANQIWGYSSAERALEWHSRGQRFDPAYLHQKLERVKKNLEIIWFQGFFFFKSGKIAVFAKGTCSLGFWWKFWKSRGQVNEENQDEFSRAGHGASSKQHQPLHKWPQILSPAVNTASPHFPQTACRLLQIDPFHSKYRKG